MAPEQIEGGPIDGRADVYAFGCVVYECLTGELPYPRDSAAALLYAHMNAPIPSLADRADVPAAFNWVVEEAMQKDPDNRPSSAGMLIRTAAHSLQRGPVAGPVPATESGPTQPGVITEKAKGPADTVAAGGTREPRRRRVPLWVKIGVHVLVYGPLWAVCYQFGRNL
jgi:serine/threonine protein kinase